MNDKDVQKAITYGLKEAVELLYTLEKELNEHGPVNPEHTHKIEQLNQLLAYAQSHESNKHPLYDFE